MKHALINSIFILSIFFLSCSEDTYKLAQEAYNAKNYIEAINLLERIEDNDLKNQEYFEMLVLAYMYRGEQLYQQTRNIDTFSGNYEKSKKFVLKEPSEDFKKQYSNLLCSLAESYFNTKAENQNLYWQYSEKATNSLKIALVFDSTNTAAKDLLEKARKENFEKLLSEANRHYDIAVKSRDIHYYFTSRKYLKKAALFDEENDGVKKLLYKLRKKMLPILDDEENLALAVTQFVQEKNQLRMMLAVKMFQDTTIYLRPENFKVVDFSGKSYTLDKKEMELFDYLGKKNLKKTTLSRKEPYVDGILVFAVPDKVNIVYLSYTDGQKELSRKYF